VGDETQICGDVILEPGIDLLGRKILRVGMAHREIKPVQVSIGAIGHADAAHMPVAPWPTGAAIGCQSVVLFLAVDCEQADAAKIGQLARDMLLGAHIGT